MKEIPLTQGQVALVDDEDFERVNAFKWRASWCPGTKSFYAKRSIGPRSNQKTIYMHRFIMNTPKGMHCDHIHHDTLNNQKGNLRNCTPSQNNMNSRLRSNNTTGLNDVCRHSKYGYQVKIHANGKAVFLKWFKTLAEAIAARDEAIKKYHGDFAYVPDKT
ncbi:hypothetical protein D4S03_09200 [bacterium]|nr:MAG: hypothetical protein D4S03_09200 [bacterium]